jgi:hypothetical protein
MKRSTVPVASVLCDRCDNCLMESEARVSRRALNAVLCWRCRARLGNLPSVHQAPAGCALWMAGTAFGLWRATLRTADGREFTGQAWTDHQALASARTAAVAAGVAL